MSLIFEASEYARKARCGEIVSQLEYLSEEFVYLHRQVLELPPQKSTALANVDDAPF
jgi:hypothetical protein